MTTQVLITSWYTGLGGGETDLLSLADSINPDAYCLHLLLPREGQLADKWRDRDLPVHFVPFRGATTLFVPMLWTRFPAATRFAEVIRQHAIDIIHADYHSLPFAYGASRQTDTPLLWTVHGWWFRPKVWQRAFFRQIPAVARSKSIRDGFLGDPPFMSPDKLPVVYSGIDTDRFHPNLDKSPIYDAFNLDNNQPIVAMIARFQRVKGHHTFQAMARYIAQHMPNVQFIVAGDDVFGVAKDSAYRDDILQAAQTDNILKHRLQYIGFRDDVERVMAAADVVVTPSEFESYGKVNLEAMACGTPIVSTNQGGPAETVRDGIVGYLVPPNQPQRLAEKVLDLLQNTAKQEQMGRVARHYIVENFSAEATARAYEKLFKEIQFF